jgi:hypothetical protein
MMIFCDGQMAETKGDINLVRLTPPQLQNSSFAIPTRQVRRDARPMELAGCIGRAAPHQTMSGT